MNAETDGIRMEPQATWRVFDVSDLYEFVRHLHELVSEGSTLYLEGTPSSDIGEYVSARRPKEVSEVASGSTIRKEVQISLWPPRIGLIPIEELHMVINEDNLEGLCELMQNHAEPEVCDHLHVYRDGKIILEGFDWYDGIFYLSDEIGEDKVKAFCERLDCKYERSYDYCLEDTQ